MAFTPASSLVPYCSPSDFLARKDVRPVGQLVRDDGTQALAFDLATDPNLIAALMAASGRLESAASLGGKYKIADLAAMVGPPATASGEMLKSIVADITAHALTERRWSSAADTLAGYQSAEVWLEKLGQGLLLLPFAETLAASVPKNVDMQQTDFNHLNNPSRNVRAFGVRASYYPRGSM